MFDFQKEYEDLIHQSLGGQASDFSSNKSRSSTWLGNVFNTIKDTVQGVTTNIKDWFKSVGTDVKDWAQNTFDGEFFDPEANLNVLNSLGGQLTGSRLTNAEMQQNAFNAEEAQKQRDWEEMMSNTAYQRQVEDMKSAGINPALAMNGSSGASTPSGAAASGSGGSPAQLFDFMLSLVNMSMQKKMNEAQIANLGAMTMKTHAETRNIETEGEYLADYKELINKGLELSNSLTSEKIEQVKHEINLLKQDLEKAIKETDNEFKRGLYIDAQKRLSEVESNRIVELVPFEKNLKAAQTEAEKSNAALNMYKAMHEKGLLDEGVVYAELDKLSAEISVFEKESDRKAAETKLHEFRSSIQSGSIAEKLVSGDSRVDQWIRKQVSEFTSSVSVLGELLTAPLGRVLGN